MRTIATLTLALALAFGLANAHETPQTIDLDMVAIAIWHMSDIEWAGDEPLSGETSTFDGRCSIPSEYLRTGTFEGPTFPIGHGWGTSEQCGRFVWETDADGRRVIRGDLTSDGIGTMETADGGRMSVSFDATSTYDPVMGMVIYTMDIQVDDMSGMPGLAFVSGRLEANYAIPDVEAMMMGAIETVGVVTGSATFLPTATD